jgi:hypothetical protein
VREKGKKLLLEIKKINFQKPLPVKKELLLLQPLTD